ncbi:MAG: 50S ribosomal protein L11 methyltransferase [Pseudomonadota bacterium]
MSDHEPQCKLVYVGTRESVETAFAVLEPAFEDDGYAISTFEIDDALAKRELSIYVPVSQGEHVLQHAKEISGLDFGIEEIPDVDWVTKSLEGLAPVRAKRFVVHGSHDRAVIQPNDISIEIDAGQAFGTGHHGTTFGCLTLMQRLIARRRPRNILDLGTGSGVLAIGATKLAKTCVLATDIDPIATRVAKTNAKLNGVQGFVNFQTATGFGNRVFADTGPFDLIIANILPRPLMAMASDIGRHIETSGDLLLSGILTSQRMRVLSAFRLQGFFHVKTQESDGWVTLHLRKRR